LGWFLDGLNVVIINELYQLLIAYMYLYLCADLCRKRWEVQWRRAISQTSHGNFLSVNSNWSDRATCCHSAWSQSAFSTIVHFSSRSATQHCIVSEVTDTMQSYWKPPVIIGVIVLLHYC